MLCSICNFFSAIPEAVYFAGFGGLAIKLLDLAELPYVRKANRPDFKSGGYWTLFCIHPLLGAFLAWAYIKSDIPMKPIVAVNIGITAPLILRAMASKHSDGIIPLPPEA